MVLCQSTCNRERAHDDIGSQRARQGLCWSFYSNVLIRTNQNHTRTTLISIFNDPKTLKRPHLLKVLKLHPATRHQDTTPPAHDALALPSTVNGVSSTVASKSHSNASKVSVLLCTQTCPHALHLSQRLIS